MPFRFLKTIFVAAALFSAACGDYRPCDVLALRVCDECPRVADYWQAACLCVENKTLKEKGYKCLEPVDEDEVRCHATLENWDENTCAELN
ncbi:MAG: hypothetical protein C4523_00210 [Myxococcales bacterium]|nr:MAG: hypothetical protein C4523_00210 [Myxococcales bacterium]